MPLYEYVCQKCGRKTEVLQRMNERPLRICPHCGGKKLKKAFSAPAIQFKGSGFYITDYRSKSYKEQQKKESGAPAPAKDEPKSKPKPKEGAPKTH
jgi:putative FmdB family regulatory protein